MSSFGEPRYGMTKVLGDLSHAEAIERTTAALKTQGFGVLTTIDMTATLSAKIGVDLGVPYTILGACNPPLAHKAVTADAGIGLLLPCNVVVTADERGAVVSTIDPDAMFEVAHSDALSPIAADVKRRLAAALEAL